MARDSALDTEFLYATGLAAGLGSNDIGLDRGQAGGGRLVSFERVGPKILMVQPNESFRSSSANPAERRSVEDSFAKSYCGVLRLRPKATDACWWMPPISSFATVMAPRTRFGGNLSRRPGSQRALPAAHQGISENSEIEVHLTFALESGGGRGGGFGAGPARVRPLSALEPGAAADFSAAFSPEPSPASLPRPIRSPCANITRWLNCPTAITSPL